MKLYMIYPAKADGVSASFEAIYCSSDASASRRASAVLSEHDSATKVSVWQGDRLVSSRGGSLSQERQNAPALTVGDQTPDYSPPMSCPSPRAAGEAGRS